MPIQCRSGAGFGPDGLEKIDIDGSILFCFVFFLSPRRFQRISKHEVEANLSLPVTYSIMMSALSKLGTRGHKCS